MESTKKNYKMYKAGKIWIFSSIIASSLAIGINTSVDNIHADGNVNKETAMSMKSTNDKLVQNIQNNITIPADYVKQAKDDGPFTAGVNQVIPFESFGGDGMLTRLLLKDAQMSPWSNNGTAMNQALLPVSGLEDGQYFYEVDLAGDLSGLQGQALIDKLSANGAKTYGATVKIYKAGADGKPDLTHTIAVKSDVKIAVDDDENDKSDSKLVQNIQNNVMIPSDYVKQAKGDGPFTAGVNQVIPFESFGGDGMLTRLLLKDAQMSPWSNNGTAMNQALLPVSGLEDGQYFYEVDLAGDLSRLQGQALIDKLSANGAKTYGATVRIYKAGADGKPDLTHTIAVKSDVKIAVDDDENDKSDSKLVQNIQNNVMIPSDYVKQAKGDGPFTAGVNQVIPFESFGGDGMLTRLLLKDAQMSPWSNNGTAMNQALLPVSGLEDGQYFYEVDLAGDLSGLQGQALIDKLSANGAKTYGATVKIYKAGADGKPDLTHTVAVKDDVKIAIGDKKDGSSSNNIMDSKNPDMNNSTMNSKDSATSDANSGMMNSKDSATSDMKMKEAAMLPSTGVNESKPLVLLGTLLLSIFSLFGLIMTRKNKAK
ncbi:SSURE domain-containing protein [Weissella paramesenteroides]|uniref:SSURE domain-containing protein n=1 Tax=Weissella paramesenteroides TaxID=1249 RepID=UPI003F743B42